MAKAVADIPLKFAIVDNNGFASRAFRGWLLDVFNRIGGNSALSNIELESVISEQITDDIAELQSDVLVLEASSTTYASQILALQNNINELNQGPNL